MNTERVLPDVEIDDLFDDEMQRWAMHKHPLLRDQFRWAEARDTLSDRIKTRPDVRGSVEGLHPAQRRAYARRMIRNWLIDEIRKTRRLTCLEGLEGSERLEPLTEPSPEPEFHQRMDRAVLARRLPRILARALGLMAPLQRARAEAVIRLTWLSDTPVTLEAIGETAGCSARDVCVARKQLRDALETAGVGAIWAVPHREDRRYHHKNGRESASADGPPSGDGAVPSSGSILETDPR